MKSFPKLRKQIETAIVDVTLEQIILDISRYGRPSIFQFSVGGWNASVRVNISAHQTTVSVEGKGDTVREACEQLLQNLKSTIAQLGH